MLKHLYQHWITTLSGAGLAGLHVAISGCNWKHMAIAGATAFLGAVAEDPKIGAKPAS